MEKEELACVRISLCDHLKQRHYTQRKFDVLRGFEVVETRCINCHKVLALEISAFGGTATCKRE